MFLALTTDTCTNVLIKTLFCTVSLPGKNEKKYFKRSQYKLHTQFYHTKNVNSSDVILSLFLTHFRFNVVCVSWTSCSNCFFPSSNENWDRLSCPQFQDDIWDDMSLKHMLCTRIMSKYGFKTSTFTVHYVLLNKAFQLQNGISTVRGHWATSLSILSDKVLQQMWLQALKHRTQLSMNKLRSCRMVYLLYAGIGQQPSHT